MFYSRYDDDQLPTFGFVQLNRFVRMNSNPGPGRIIHKVHYEMVERP